MPHVQIDNLKFHYQQAGPAGAPDVVLIHGVTGNLAVWMLSGLMTKLGKQFRVTAYDMRGHGYSDTPPDHYTTSDMAADFALLHRALDLRPAFVMGHSFGAAVALHAAQQYPEIVAGAVLSDPFVPALHHLQANPKRWLGFRAYKKNAATAGMAIAGNLWNLSDMLQQAANLSPRKKKMFIERAGEATLNRLVRLASTTCGEDVAQLAGLTMESIPKITTPCVCLHGEFSPFLPMCLKLIELLPKCEKDSVPKAQHFAFEENPADFIDRVERHFCVMSGFEPTAPTVPLDHVRRGVMTDTPSRF
jgi:pimeloyl-ACP methyl ester carboxylesterase